MKKLLLIVGTFLIIFPSVNASSNNLFFKEENNKIVYESNDGNVFMKHLDMIPGSNYTDEINIKNETSKTYKLYLKVNVEEQSNNVDEFLDYLNMNLYMGENLIYSGNIRGLDYSSTGINLQNSVLLKEFASKDASTLIVETNLDSSYSNKDFDEDVTIEWIFYAQYEDEDPSQIVELPKTDKNSFPAIIVSLIILIIGIVLVVYGKKQYEK